MPAVAALILAGREAANLRWVAGAMLGAGALLSRMPVGGPPCPLRTLTGVPCPWCGMTTGVKATLQGDLAAAVAANPLGAVAVVVAVLVLLVRPASIRVSWPVVGVALGASWIFQLGRFGFL